MLNKFIDQPKTKLWFNIIPFHGSYKVRNRGKVFHLIMIPANALPKFGSNAHGIFHTVRTELPFIEFS